MGKHRNYSKYSTPIENTESVETLEIVDDLIDTVAVSEIRGVVTDCVRLNVREAPYKNAPVVCTVDCLTEVVIDDEGPSDEFYRIYTESGVEGFCMKQYITIK